MHSTCKGGFPRRGFSPGSQLVGSQYTDQVSTSQHPPPHRRSRHETNSHPAHPGPVRIRLHRLGRTQPDQLPRQADQQHRRGADRHLRDALPALPRTDVRGAALGGDQERPGEQGDVQRSPGGVEPLPPNIAAGGLYLQVSIRNSGGVLEILTPRQRQTSSPYAFQAANADRVGGKTPEEIVTGHTHDISEITGTIDAHTLGGLAPSAFAAAGHNHDERYYSVIEVDSLLDLKSGVSHTHDGRYYTNSQVDDLISAEVNPLKDQIAELQTALTQLTNLFVGVTREDDGKILRFSGMNVQVVNGMGETESINGLGNLIIGYDEINQITWLERCSKGEYSDQATCEANNGTWSHTHKSGSHYLVTGSEKIIPDMGE
jgi:hypothetical protein